MIGLLYPLRRKGGRFLLFEDLFNLCQILHVSKGRQPLILISDQRNPCPLGGFSIHGRVPNVKGMFWADLKESEDFEDGFGVGFGFFHIQ